MALHASPLLRRKAQKFKENYHFLPVRWVNSEDLHFTLILPWEENDIPKINQILRRIRGEKFCLKLQRIKLGPTLQKPRLIWAEGEEPPALKTLRYNLKESLRDVVCHGERPFKLHLTLARFKKSDFANFPFKKFEKKINWPEEVDSFVLMESPSPKERSYKHKKYKILYRYQLA